MFSKERVLEACQKILGVESSQRSGTAVLKKTLTDAFPFIEWKEIPVHGESTVFYCETNPSKEKIDLLCYTNVDTGNPSHLSLWTETDFDPLAITFKKNKIFGLGAAHEKISIVPQLLSLEKIINTDSNILVAAGFGRESKMRGAKRLIAEVLKGRSVGKVCVAHPTENKIFHGSSGRLKTKVFFPFTKQEKELRRDHDIRENISSQSKVYSYTGGEGLISNTLFKVIESCKLLPIGTVVLDLDGGSATVTEPETTYFEVDVAPPFEDSLVSKFENFGELLKKLDLDLREKFKGGVLKKAIHIGRAFDSEEGVTFFGYNLIPAHITKGELDVWFEEFRGAVSKVGGEVMITDAKTPYVNKGKSLESDNYCDDVTEASLFAKVCDDIVIFGPGKGGRSRQPNEFVDLDEMIESCHGYSEMYKKIIEGLV